MNSMKIVNNYIIVGRTPQRTQRLCNLVGFSSSWSDTDTKNQLNHIMRVINDLDGNREDASQFAFLTEYLSC
jgi:hypothetical protein